MSVERLNCLVIADPSADTAAHIAEQSARLAEKRLVATGVDEALALCQEHQPEVFLFSLELAKVKPEALVPKVLKIVPEALIGASFRELDVSRMEKLGRLGIAEFLAQPIDFVQLYRAASERFGTPFRRHTRFFTNIEVRRADGVRIGTTVDVSMGGLCMKTEQDVSPGQSLLVDLDIPGNDAIRVRCHILERPEDMEESCAHGQFENFRAEEQRRLSAYLETLR